MATALPDSEVRFSLSSNVSSKHQKKNEFFRDLRVSKRDLLHTSVHSDAEAISTHLVSSKRRKLSGTSSAELNWVGFPVEENIEGESHDSFYVSNEILKFSLQKKMNYWGVTRESLRNY